MQTKPEFAAAKGFTGKVWRNGIFVSASFHVQNGKIQEGLKQPAVKADYVIPPFIDPHIHGGWGFDVHKGHFAPLEKKLLHQGIFCAVPTLDNNSFNSLSQSGADFMDFLRSRPDSIFPFLRIEGPFISSYKKGFQNSRWIQKITTEAFERLFGVPGIGMFTFAPEIEGSSELVKHAFKKGIIPSVGHSRAGFEEFMRVYPLGVKHFTHYPNAMSGMHHRDIGLTGAGLYLNDLQLEVIGDGVHNSREFLLLLKQIRGDAFALTSDLIPPAFSKLDRFDGRRLAVHGAKITTADGTLAGGAVPVSQQVPLLFKWGWTPENLVRMACENARKYMNLPVPSLEAGQPADFLILDRSMELTAVYRQGRLVSKEESEWKTA